MVVAENGLIPLDEAYERCRCETEEWAKTFYLGTMLMPPDKRRAIWAIYVWCRRTDEIMDSPEAMSKPRDELFNLLDQWERHTRSVFDGQAVNWLDQVMVDTIQRFDQPLQPYLDMIEGMRMDLKWTRYSTFEELKLYCYRVAGTVGLMSERVMGVDPGSLHHGAQEPIRQEPLLPWVLRISSPISSGMLVKIVIAVVFIFR